MRDRKFEDTRDKCETCLLGCGLTVAGVNKAAVEGTAEESHLREPRFIGLEWWAPHRWEPSAGRLRTGLADRNLELVARMLVLAARMLVLAARMIVLAGRNWEHQQASRKGHLQAANRLGTAPHWPTATCSGRHGGSDRDGDGLYPKVRDWSELGQYGGFITIDF